METIETRYCGPTDYRGSRIIATAAGGQRHVIPYPHELRSDAAHRKAATELAEIMGWLKNGNRLVGASNRRAGYSWVFVDAAGKDML